MREREKEEREREEGGAERQKREIQESRRVGEEGKRTNKDAGWGRRKHERTERQGERCIVIGFTYDP